MIRSLKTALVVLLTLATASSAVADNPKVNVQVFRPSAHHDDLFTVMGSTIAEHMRWSASAMLNFGKNALVFVDRSGGQDNRGEVIQNQLTLDLMGSIALIDRLSVGLAVPLFLVNSGGDAPFLGPAIDTDAINSFAMGDIRLSPKVGVIMRKDNADGLGLSAALRVNLPTGDADSFVSDGFLLTPKVVVDYKAGPLLVAANLGYRLRFDDQTLPLDTEIGGEFNFGIGGRYVVIEDMLSVIGEIYGSSSDYSTANNTHLEGIIGGQLMMPDKGLTFTVGGGSGFTKGYGNTKFRFFAGARFSPDVIVDQDGDGLLDDVDKCPLKPEDTDGFQDTDGCPDPDNDNDKVLDAADKCPNDAEDNDGYQDDDGCPDFDNDGDGIADGNDKCPMEAEDVDEFQDTDGCPDPDNDGDGIVDLEDKCPTQPETMNGHEDTDGCPDETLAKVEKGKIVILDKIYFDTGKARIKDESFPVVRAVSGILKANPQIKSVTIEGHTDDRGSARRNMKLSQARANSVMTWLVNDGVQPERLEAKGYGEDKPAVEGRSKQAREKNRRVEFTINDAQ